jgi:imidazole glycerol-phosphate synthase subunit HisH
VIGVIDYRAGNAPSVSYALTRLGIEHRLVTKPDELADADRLVLPGVGAARATMDSLAESGLIDPLSARVHEERVPFLGICIGLQVLFDHSDEGDVDCLGWVPGRVQRFVASQRIPQIGWNEVRFRRAHPVTATLPEGGYFYFVNSFYAQPADPDAVLGVTEYGVDFCSVVAHENIVATQFHAEKSGRLGLELLTAFSKWDGA